MRQINKIKEKIRVNSIACKSSIRVMVNEEVEIQKPGVVIDRVIREAGNAYIDEMRIRENQVSLGGVLDFQVLFAEKNTGLPQCEMGQLRFEDVVKIPDVRVEDDINLETNVDWITARVINERKMIIKAQITVFATATNTREVEILTGVEKQEDMQVKSEKLEVLEMVKELNDTVRIKNRISVSGGKDAISYLLWKNVRMKNIEYQVEDGKLIISGEANVFFMYAPDGEKHMNQWQESTIPFSSVIEAYGKIETYNAVGPKAIGEIERTDSNTDCEIIPYVEIAIQNMEMILIPNEMGENREVEVDILLKANAKLFVEKEIEVLDDIYSLKTDMEPIKSKIKYNQLLVKNTSRSRNVVKINVDGNKEGILQICASGSEVRIENVSIVEDAIIAEGKINAYVMFATNDDQNPICTSSKEMDFIHKIDAEAITKNDEYYVNWRVEQTTANMISSEETEVRIIVAMEVFAIKGCESELAIDVKEEEARQGKMPYIRAHVAQKGETLWKLAKENRTTVDRIREINNLKSDNIQPGDRLLVAK